MGSTFLSNVVVSPCPVCGSYGCEELPFWSRQGTSRFAVAACPRCSHEFVATPPTSEELTRLYDDYYSRDTRVTGRVAPTFRDRVLIRRLKRGLPENARILEIGCNFGETLLAFPRGYQLHGVELSESAAKVAGAHPRLSVRRGFFETMDFGDLKFDCILALAVIEHVRDPIGFLTTIRQRLVDHGVLVLMTGDHGSWYARKMGPEWRLYHSVGHLHFFSQESLTIALQRSGLEPQTWRWAGPRPGTVRLPKRLGRLLHSQATCLLFNWAGASRLGSNMYSWANASRVEVSEGTV